MVVWCLSMMDRRIGHVREEGRKEGRKERRKRVLVLSVDCAATITITMKEDFIIHISILASSPLA